MKDSPTEQFPYTQIAVIGAAGKMGSGISLLLLEDLARNKISHLTKVTEKKCDYILTLIDTSHEGLEGLKKYLSKHMLKWAEKNISFLRQAVANIHTLISNQEVIDHFMEMSMAIVHCATSLEEAKNSELIFEAISEDIETKVNLFKTLQKQSNKTPYFFTNTSSIPISVLNEQAQLNGKIIGFHFYNPPAVQKLLELIPLENGDPKLTQFAEDLAQRLNKKVVISKDVAGFIGNGYFLREIIYSCQIAEMLGEKYGKVQGIFLVNKLTKEYLLRPMGIFQLIDYVGIDVVININTIMHQYLQLPKLPMELFQPLLEAKLYGGQYPDGKQKNGFFQYTDNCISGIYSKEKGQYISLEAIEWLDIPDLIIPFPHENITLDKLNVSSDKDALLERFFNNIFKRDTPGIELTRDFLRNLQQISNDLVQDQVAKSGEDVDTVLMKGFHHPYGIHALFNLPRNPSWQFSEKKSM